MQVSGSNIQTGDLPTLPVITIGGLAATIQFAGLVSPALFQFNVMIPSNARSGDNALVATYNGETVLQSVFITIQGSTPMPASVAHYVAPNGNDFWSGTLPAPNSTNTDGPFGTFEKARAFVQSINKAGVTQINVRFRAGTSLQLKCSHSPG